LSRHVTPRHHTTPHAFWLCQACRTARLDTRVSTRSTRQTCRVVSRRDVTSEVKFGLMGSQLQLQSTSGLRVSGVEGTNYYRSGDVGLFAIENVFMQCYCEALRHVP